MIYTKKEITGKVNNILVVGAHFDDAELGAGGIIAKYIAKGKRVYKITLTDTEVISDLMNLNISSETGRDNSKKACEVLGTLELDFPLSKYGKLEYSQGLMQKMEDIIAEYEIDTCIFHFKEDYNTDHLAAHKLCYTAARHCDNLLMYQSNPYIIGEAFYPNVFIDISDYIEKKKEALLCYEEAHNRQGNLFQTNIERNRIWGYGNHVEYAEGFMAVKIKLEEG